MITIQIDNPNFGIIDLEITSGRKELASILESKGVIGWGYSYGVSNFMPYIRLTVEDDFDMTLIEFYGEYFIVSEP